MDNSLLPSTTGPPATAKPKLFNKNSQRMNVTHFLAEGVFPHTVKAERFRKRIAYPVRLYFERLIRCFLTFRTFLPPLINVIHIGISPLRLSQQ